ncbi:hypothetical protein CK203_104477 [Vitis vinifera]|uniref:Reverse transcriptase Ty1/copia-type domain-containing protein n=1 Tax=Vitis vinifera TaxID=29760 RepID=A0A438EA09_VITVI|nr:hypothetical protein CK203_104477 [Vitis vinifera]
MVVEKSIHVIFYESNDPLQERESFDDDLGLETSMGRLPIEDRRQQEEIGEDLKKEESLLALPPPQQVQGESCQDLPKDWNFVINHPQDQIIEFSKCMHSEFEMRMMGELNFFLGLQIKQLKEGTFINQAKYIRDLLKRFNMEEAKTIKTPMNSSIKPDKDEKGKSIDSTMYRGMIDDFEQGLDRLKALDWIFGKIRCSGFSFGPHFPSPASHSQFLLHFRVLRVSIVLVSLSTSPFSSVSPFLMAPMRESIASRA